MGLREKDDTLAFCAREVAVLDIHETKQLAQKHVKAGIEVKAQLDGCTAQSAKQYANVTSSHNPSSITLASTSELVLYLRCIGACGPCKA